MSKTGRIETGQVYTKKGWRRFILRRVLAVVAVIVVVMAVAGFWASRALPGIALAEISRLTNTRMEMGTFKFHRNGTVSIEGLVVRPDYEEASYDDEILRAKHVEAKFSRRSLLLLAPRVEEIRVEGFFLDICCNLDTGRWNVGGLDLGVPRDHPSDVPAISLVQGHLRYRRIADGQDDVAMSVPIEAHLGRSETDPDRYDFEIRTGTLAGGYGDSNLKGSWRSGRFELAGGLSSTDIPSLERAWAVDLVAAELAYDENRDYKLDFRVKGLRTTHSPEVDALRLGPETSAVSGPLGTVQRFFARFRPFGDVGEISIKANGNLDAINDSQLTGRVVCTDVSLRDRTFPYDVDGLAGQVDFTQSMVVIDGLNGKHGDVDVHIEGWSQDDPNERQYHYEVRSDNMILDESLYAALTPGEKQQWDSFHPSGVAQVEYIWANSTSPGGQTRLSVNLKDVAAIYTGFPYPLRNLTGKVVFDSDRVIVSDVVTHTGPTISLDGQVTETNTDRPSYHITVDAQDLPLDETFREALPATPRRTLRRFDPSGRADFHAIIFTPDVNEARKVTFLADMEFKDTSIKVESLPARLSGVSGRATLMPELLNIEKATGQYGKNTVSLSGTMSFTDDSTLPWYRFEVAAEKTVLEPQVIELLPASMKEAVAVFRPSGPVNLAVDVTKADVNAPADYDVVVECLGNEVNWQRFAYPFSDVRGTVTINTDTVKFNGLTAKPALQSEPGLDPLVTINGEVSLAPETRGQAEVTVTARDLLLTQKLGEALPGSFAGLYRDLSPRGPVDLELPVLKVFNEGQDRRRVEFSGKAIVPTCSLSVSGTGSELSGQLEVEGVYDTEAGLTQGRVRLAADRFTVKSKDITDLRADIVYDPNAQTWTAHNFLGRCYDGKVLGQLEIARLEPGVVQYLMTAALSQVSLQPFLLAGNGALETERAYTSGTMDAVLSLGAKVGNGASQLGLCRVDVADMQVGRVSPLANLLAVLSLTEPTDYVFERMLIESYLRRNKLLITKLDMSGRNLAFTGAGTMDLGDGNINLTLTARGRRLAAAQPSLLQSLTEGIGGGVVRMDVTGTSDNPKVETRALPMLEDSLRILGTPR